MNIETHKIETLLRLADNLIEGTVLEFPKNLINFKLSVDSLKMDLEDLKSIDEKPTPLTIPPIINEEVKSKRKRRTKAEMEADAAFAAGKIESIEKGIEAATKLVDKITSTPTTGAKISESVKNQKVNVSGNVEDWEKENITDTKEIDDINELPFTYTPSEEITFLIDKYPDPLNINNLDRTEKVNLIADMLTIKKLVGNESTTDIKEKLDLLELKGNIHNRALRFLIVLPHLQVEIK